jgi:adenylate cyclase class 2
MKIEFEATFRKVNKAEIRQKLAAVSATLVKPEFMQRRVVFNLPGKNAIKGRWLRVRDEADKVTLSLKIIDGEKIEDQHEAQITVDNFDEAVLILTMIGCDKKAYQESKREIWSLDGTEITIDEWPFLEPFVEIEGDSEKVVKGVSVKLGFKYSEALFCAADTLYSLKYGISKDNVNNHTPEILFNMDNPFLPGNGNKVSKH